MTRIELNEEQRQAAEQLAGPVLISAGAGSGKTRVLTERCANAVVGLPAERWHGVGVDSLLAITFTEKAAGELAERVRAALRAAGRAEDARRVDAAWISTIHGMCFRILRGAALEAGVDPAFSVLDSVQSSSLRQRAFEEAARAALHADENASRLFALYGYDVVATSVLALHDATRVAGIPTERLAVADRIHARALLAEADSFFSGTASRLSARGGAAALQHAECCSLTAGALCELAVSGIAGDALAEAVWRLLQAHEIPRAWAGVKDEVDEIRAMRIELARSAAACVVVAPTLALLDLTGRYAQCYAGIKTENGCLDFDDLQIEALRFLSGPHGGAWRERFALTMVDEFQDTDALQLALVERLAGANLCSVGDERQSIYGFRGANIAVYRQHRGVMLERGAPDIGLRVNYRSHAHILGFVNRVFGSPGMFGDKLLVLKHGRSEDGRPTFESQGARVGILFAGRDKTRSSADARRVLADSVARNLRQLRDEDGIGLGDMVVLLRSYTHAPEYAEALRLHGIEAIVVGGSRFFNRPEVAALRSFVRVLANVRDEEAIGPLLCSGMCSMSDDGLLSLREAVSEGRAQNLWEALSAAAFGQADRLRAERLIRAIESAGVRLGRQSLAEILLRATEETGLDARLLSAGLEGGEAYANVLKFVRLATQFEQQGDGGPAAFSAYLDSKEQYGDHEAPASLVKDGSDAVRIMSIHASKGLEFPVVVVPELGEHGNSSGANVRWDLAADPPVVSMALPASWSNDSKLRRPPTFCAIDDEKKAEEAEEDKRLLYVAFTRAQDVLLIAGAASLSERSQERTLLRQVTDALGERMEARVDRVVTGGEDVHYRLVDADAEASEHEQTECEAADSDEGRQLEWLEAIGAREHSVEAGTVAPRRFSYSGLKAFERCPRRFRHASTLRLGTELREPGRATDFGSAFHAAVELFGEDLPIAEERLRAIARYNGLDETARRRLAVALDAYRESETAAMVRRFSSVRRESAFAIDVGEAGSGFVLDGSIDLYAREREQALIVDFKTGLTKISEDEAKVAYELQARCYALAAYRDGAKRVEVVFVRPEARQAIPFSFGTADALETEARLLALYSRICAGEAGATPKSERECADCGLVFGCPSSRAPSGAS